MMLFKALTEKILDRPVKEVGENSQAKSCFQTFFFLEKSEKKTKKNF
jgi:hypothetical protein